MSVATVTDASYDIPGLAQGDWSGRSVSMSADGTRVAIGATGRYANSNDGNVRVFEYSVSSQKWKILGDPITGDVNSGDASGFSVSLSGDGTHVAIGAPHYDVSNIDNVGYTRVYKYNTIDNEWNIVGTQTDLVTGTGVDDYGGWSVSLNFDGSVVAIGTYWGTVGTSYPGYTQIFRYDSNGWNRLGEALSGARSNNKNGWSVSLSDDGTRVAIGEPNYDVATTYTDEGRVRVFEYTNGTWGVILDVEGTQSDTTWDDKDLGYSVALSGDGKRVAVGAPQYETLGDAEYDRGLVYVYEINEDNPASPTLLLQKEGEDVHNFNGGSVSLNTDGTVVAMGARWNDGDTGDVNDDRGHVRVFRQNDPLDHKSEWSQMGVDIDGVRSIDNSGWSVSLSADGTRVAIGAPGWDNSDDDNTGRARVFAYREDANGNGRWTQEIDYDSFSSRDELQNAIVDYYNNPTGGSAKRRYGQDIRYWKVGENIAGGGGVTFPNDKMPENVTNLVLEWDFTGFTSFKTMFENCTSLKTLTLTKPGTVSGVTDMSSMFEGCTALTTVPKLEKLKQNTKMEKMFDGCTAIDDFSNFRCWNVDVDEDNNLRNIWRGLSSEEKVEEIRIHTTGWVVSGGSGLQKKFVFGSGTDQLGDTWFNGVVFCDNPGVGKFFDVTSWAEVQLPRAYPDGGTYTLTNSQSRSEEFDRANHRRRFETVGEYTLTYAYNVDDVDRGGDSVTIQVQNGTVYNSLYDIPGLEAGDYSGRSVSMSADGTRVAVGAVGAVGDNWSPLVYKDGNVRVFEYSVSSHKWERLGNPITGDVNSGDANGYSVSLSGDGTHVAIGAPYYDDTTRSDVGYTRVFKYNPATTAWEIVGKQTDLVTGTGYYDYGGWSVSLNLDGSVVAIGTYLGTTGDNYWPGYTRIYRYESEVWIQLGEDLSGAMSSDRNGYSVSLSDDGTRVAIGEPGYDVTNNEGRVRVFEYDSGANSWGSAILDVEGTQSDSTSNEKGLGYSVALSGDGKRVAVGAPYYEGGEDAKYDRGFVYVYEINEDYPASPTELLEIEGEDFHNFNGGSVSLNTGGTVVAMGARWYDADTGVDQGHVRVFRQKDPSKYDSEWSQTGLDIDGVRSDDESGYSVSLSADGTRVAIGAPGWDKPVDGIGNDNTGHVRVFVYREDVNGVGRWTQHVYEHVRSLSELNSALVDFYGDDEGAKKMVKQKYGNDVAYWDISRVSMTTKLQIKSVAELQDARDAYYGSVASARESVIKRYGDKPSVWDISSDNINTNLQFKWMTELQDAVDNYYPSTSNNNVDTMYGIISNWDVRPDIVITDDKGGVTFPSDKMSDTNLVLEWDFTGFTSFASMFKNCTSLETLTLTQPGTVGGVTDMSSMFQGCTALTSVPKLENLAQNTNMSHMFDGCTKITDFSNFRCWNTVINSNSNLNDIWSKINVVDEIKKYTQGWVVTATLPMNKVFGRLYKETDQDDYVIPDNGWFNGVVFCDPPSSSDTKIPFPVGDEIQDIVSQLPRALPSGGTYSLVSSSSEEDTEVINIEPNLDGYFTFDTTTTPVGEYILQYSVDTRDSSSLDDYNPPKVVLWKIDVPGDIHNIELGDSVSWEHATINPADIITMNTDLTISSPQNIKNTEHLFPLGETTVTYTATDSSDNTATASFTVTVTDKTAPNISNLPSDLTFKVGEEVTWTEPTATDNSGAAPALTRTPSPDYTFPLGDTIVTYTATDSSGNEATASFTVTISPLTFTSVAQLQDAIDEYFDPIGWWTVRIVTGLTKNTLTEAKNLLKHNSGATRYYKVIDFHDDTNYAKSTRQPFPEDGNHFYPTTTSNKFAMHATAKIYIEETGKWTFGFSSDDGGQLLIDETEVAVFRSTRGTGTNLGVLSDLSQGYHQVDFYYFEWYGSATCQVFQANESGDKTNTPTNEITQNFHLLLSAESLVKRRYGETPAQWIVDPSVPAVFLHNNNNVVAEIQDNVPVWQEVQLPLGFPGGGTYTLTGPGLESGVTIDVTDSSQPPNYTFEQAGDYTLTYSFYDSDRVGASLTIKTEAESIISEYFNDPVEELVDAENGDNNNSNNNTNKGKHVSISKKNSNPSGSSGGGDANNSSSNALKLGSDTTTTTAKQKRMRQRTLIRTLLQMNSNKNRITVAKADLGFDTDSRFTKSNKLLLVRPTTETQTPISVSDLAPDEAFYAELEINEHVVFKTASNTPIEVKFTRLEDQSDEEQYQVQYTENGQNKTETKQPGNDVDVDGHTFHIGSVSTPAPELQQPVTFSAFTELQNAVDDYFLPQWSVRTLLLKGESLPGGGSIDAAKEFFYDKLFLHDDDLRNVVIQLSTHNDIHFDDDTNLYSVGSTTTSSQDSNYLVITVTGTIYVDQQETTKTIAFKSDNNTNSELWIDNIKQTTGDDEQGYSYVSIDLSTGLHEITFRHFHGGQTSPPQFQLYTKNETNDYVLLQTSRQRTVSEVKQLYGEDIAEWNVSSIDNTIENDCRIIFPNYTIHNRDDDKTLILNWDFSKFKSFSKMFQFCCNLEKVQFTNVDAPHITDSSFMFRECVRLKFIEGFESIPFVNMSSMFENCFAIQTVPSSLLTTPSATNVSSMFYNCTLLQNVNSNDIAINLPTATNTKEMFNRCVSMQDPPNFSGVGLPEATNLTGMFGGCTALKTPPDFSANGLPKAEELVAMFVGCESLETPPCFGGEGLPEAVDLRSMFEGCVSLSEPPKFEPAAGLPKATTLIAMFTDCQQLITPPDFSGVGLPQVIYLMGMFDGCVSMQDPPNFSGVGLPEATNLTGMFENCTALKTPPDFSANGLPKAILLNAMFSGCASLETPPCFGGEGLPEAVDLTSMFEGCVSLSEPPKFEPAAGLPKATTLTTMFTDCQQLITPPNFSGVGLPQVIYLMGMFDGCNKLSNLDPLRCWNFKNNDNSRSVLFDSMFRNIIANSTDTLISNVKAATLGWQVGIIPHNPTNTIFNIDTADNNDGWFNGTVFCNNNNVTIVDAAQYDQGQIDQVVSNLPHGLPEGGTYRLNVVSTNSIVAYEQTNGNNNLLNRISEPGTYTYTYEVSSRNGSSASLTFTVVAADKPADPTGTDGDNDDTMVVAEASGDPYYRPFGDIGSGAKTNELLKFPGAVRCYRLLQSRMSRPNNTNCNNNNNHNLGNSSSDVATDTSSLSSSSFSSIHTITTTPTPTNSDSGGDHPQLVVNASTSQLNKRQVDSLMRFGSKHGPNFRVTPPVCDGYFFDEFYIAWGRSYVRFDRDIELVGWSCLDGPNAIRLERNDTVRTMTCPTQGMTTYTSVDVHITDNTRSDKPPRTVLVITLKKCHHPQIVNAISVQIKKNLVADFDGVLASTANPKIFRVSNITTTKRVVPSQQKRSKPYTKTDTASQPWVECTNQQQPQLQQKQQQQRFVPHHQRQANANNLSL